MRFGYRRLTAMLLREGMPANHKRVYRLYREEGLVMRMRQRRRIRWNGAVTSPAAARPNQRWSIDFVSDCVSTGRVIRVDHGGRLQARVPLDRSRYLCGRVTSAPRAEKSKSGDKITTNNVHTARWTTCRPQSLHAHERRSTHEESFYMDAGEGDSNESVTKPAGRKLDKAIFRSPTAVFRFCWCE